MIKKELFLQKISPLICNGIAHRGLHTEEFTENGLKAFENAVNNNFAFELDIHLTRDNKLIVCHDKNLKRTTGKEGIIEELTSDQIRQEYRLLDGGVVPTFDEVLDLVQERVPIVTELKPVNKNHKALAMYTEEALKRIKDPKSILLISFDPRVLMKFRKSRFATSILVSDEDKQSAKVFYMKKLFDSGDFEMKMSLEDRVKKYQKDNFLNIWTIRSKEDLDKYIDYTDTVTFEKVDPEYVREKMKAKYGK